MKKQEFTELTEELVEYVKNDLQFNIDNEYAINDIDDLFDINTDALAELSAVRDSIQSVEDAIQDEDYEPTELAENLNRMLKWTYQEGEDFPLKGETFQEYIDFYSK